MRPSERSIFASLRHHGYKLTPQRRVVIHTIISSPDHQTPAELYQKVNRHHPSIGLVTIYRTLEILSEQGLICELHAGGSCPSYTVGSSQSHHHLICSDCGKVVDFTASSLSALEERLSRESGFTIDRRMLELVGRCQDCQPDVASPPG